MPVLSGAATERRSRKNARSPSGFSALALLCYFAHPTKNRHASRCNKCRLNFTLARGRQNKMYCLFSLSPLNLKLKHDERKSVWPLQNWRNVFVLKILLSPSLNRGESRCLLLPHIKSYNSLAGLCGGFLLKQAMDKMVIRKLWEEETHLTHWLKNNEGLWSLLLQIWWLLKEPFE